MKDLIAFTGTKGSGKDTAGSAFTDRGYRNVKFADALKCMIHVLLMYRGATADYAYRCIEGDLKEVPCPLLEGKTPRYAMQKLGTEWGRDLIGEGLWVNSFKDKVNDPNDNRPVVCTDCRFPNEVDTIRELGGHLVRINRAGQVIDDLHESERHIPTLDVHADISNHAESAEAFKAQIAKLFFTH